MIGMVLADLYTAISGIGYLIVRTASTFQVDKMFVPIVTLGLLGVTLTALLRMVEKRVAPWTAASRARLGSSEASDNNNAALREEHDNANHPTRMPCASVSPPRSRSSTTAAFAQSAPNCPTMRKINIGVSVAPPNVVHTSPYVAKELGFFAKRCIDANIVQFEGGQSQTSNGRRGAGHAPSSASATSRSAAA